MAGYRRILKNENAFKQILNRTEEILIETREYFSFFNRNSYTYE